MDNYVIEYKGKTYPDIDTFCKEFHAVKYKEHFMVLMEHGHSFEDALKVKYKGKRIVEDPEEIKGRKLNIGYSEEQGCYRDNRGNKFLNFTDMLDYLGLTYKTVYLRHSKGCSPKECLAKLHSKKKKSKNKDKKNIFKYEYNGKKYETKKELCADLGINYYCLSHKLKAMSLEEAVNSLVCNKYEYNGKKYESKKELCNDLGISYYSLNHKLKSMTLEEAVDNLLRKEKIYDHKGKGYNSEKEMADAYNIPPKTLWARKRLGWSLQEALEIPVSEK